jgi:hypothetical protein
VADPATAPPAPRGTPRGTGSAALLGAAWLAWFGVLQWSVVRFRVPILLTLTAVTVLLAVWLVRRVDVPRPRWLAPVVLLGSVVVTLTVPLFTYLRGGWLTAAVVVLGVGGITAAALLLVPGPRAAVAALVTAVTTQVAVAAVAVVGDPAPRIDVWVVLQQGADALARGGNLYTQQWVDSPGVQDFFPYLPWMAVLTAPGRWVAGDVRWMLLVWSLVLIAGLWSLSRGRVERAAAVAAVLVLAPGTLTQVDQAWTEPVLAALLVWFAALVHRGRAWWAVLPLALACASKQHLVLLVPMLVLWRPFGWLRTLATGALAGVLVLPWLVADPAAFVDDTVTTLLTFHPIRFANTWYLYFLNEHDVTLPFAVTGLVMAGAVVASVWAVWHRQPGVEEVLRWMALVLAVANLVNKQAFYNQFWLVAALVAASLAVSGRTPGTDDGPVAARPGGGAARPEGDASVTPPGTTTAADRTWLSRRRATPSGPPRTSARGWPGPGPPSPGRRGRPARAG